MRHLRDFLQLYAAHLRARLSVVKKSPINLWFAMGVQGAYYVAQLLFWVGVRAAGADLGMLSDRDLFAFLVTLAVVDNAYLMFFGSGSPAMQTRIASATLEPILLQPRHPLLTFALLFMDLSHLPGLLLSLACWVAYLFAFAVPPGAAVLHAAAMLAGTAILTGISFIYRLSTFWTASIVAVRNSNPSYKIMVRPLAAFSGPLRVALLTAFPALFITGVPAEILTGRRAPFWLGLGVLAAIFVWCLAGGLWKLGVRRYQVRVI